MAEKYDDVLVPFMSLMRRELHANSRKGDRPGWLAMSANTGLLEIYWHVAKLSAAVKNNDGPAIMEHSADVANMAMMVLDICGGLAWVDSSAGSNVDWKAAFEAEAAKFQQETLRTSELHQMLTRMVAMHCPAHTPGPWSRSCWQCQLVGEAQALLDKPINASSAVPSGVSASPGETFSGKVLMAPGQKEKAP